MTTEQVRQRRLTRRAAIHSAPNTRLPRARRCRWAIGAGATNHVQHAGPRRSTNRQSANDPNGSSKCSPGSMTAAHSNSCDSARFANGSSTQRPPMTSPRAISLAPRRGQSKGPTRGVYEHATPPRSEARAGRNSWQALVETVEATLRSRTGDSSEDVPSRSRPPHERSRRTSLNCPEATVRRTRQPSASRL